MIHIINSLTTWKWFLINACAYYIFRSILNIIGTIIEENKQKKSYKFTNSSEIMQYISERNTTHIPKMGKNADSMNPKILGMLGNPKYLKRYPNSNIQSWEHSLIDYLEHDENISNLGEDIEFQELNNNNQKLLT